MQNPEPRAQYLNTVLRLIDRTSLRIPRFQRDFVWGESNVVELLGSIKKGYPIGSVLTWRVESKDDYFSGYREDAFPSADESLTSFEVILDGAQRLSSLYGCLRNPAANTVYDMHYDLRGETFSHSSSVNRIEPWFVPMASLFDSRRFLQVQAKVMDLDDGEKLLARVLDLYTTFQEYQIPIIALSNTTLEDVVEVFRRVNSSGTALSTVDFVRALTWQSNFDLEETFAVFAARYRGSALEDVTDEFLIRCLAISAGLSLDSRDVLQLERRSRDAGGLSDEVTSMQDALDRVEHFIAEFGMRQISDVPYEVQRLLLFTVFFYEPNFDRRQLEIWLWESTFAEEYQSKPDSYITRLVKMITTGDVTQALAVRKPIDEAIFATKLRRGGSAITLGFDLLMRKPEVRSLLSNAPIGNNPSYSTLYSRHELAAAGFEGKQSSNRLANLIVLSVDDATAWADLRATKSVEEIHAECLRSDETAAHTWRMQGLIAPVGSDPVAVLRSRSEALLDRALGRGEFNIRPR